MSGPSRASRGDVPPPRTWHGAILAGGAATRFGSDKVFARVAGHRLIDLAAASLAEAESVTALLGPRERQETKLGELPAGVVGLADDVPGRGPLAGLATILGRHPTSWVAVLAADVPLVPAEWWRRLASAHRPNAVAIVPRDENGRWEPLAALYHGSLAPEAASAVASGDPARLALAPWLEDMEAQDRLVEVATDGLPADALLNVNRPTDAAAVEAVLRDRQAKT